MSNGGWVNGKLQHAEPVTPAELARQRQGFQDQEARRAEVRKQEDAAYDRRRQAANEEREEAAREQALAATAEMRELVERECRRDGVPDREIKAVVDAAMRHHHTAQATEAAAHGAKADRELRAYFARQGAAIG